MHRCERRFRAKKPRNAPVNCCGLNEKCTRFESNYLHCAVPKQTNTSQNARHCCLGFFRCPGVLQTCQTPLQSAKIKQKQASPPRIFMRPQAICGCTARHDSVTRVPRIARHCSLGFFRCPGVLKTCHTPVQSAKIKQKQASPPRIIMRPQPIGTDISRHDSVTRVPRTARHCCLGFFRCPGVLQTCHIPVQSAKINQKQANPPRIICELSRFAVTSRGMIESLECPELLGIAALASLDA